MHVNTKSNIDNLSLETQVENTSSINPHKLALVSSNVVTCLKSRTEEQEKFPLNEHNPNLILTKQNLSNEICQSDCIDWKNPPLKASSMNTTIVNNQLDAISFLQEYLDNSNSDALIDLIHELAQEISTDQNKVHCSYSAMNNNHLHWTPMLNSDFQISNNKDKKTKKEKSTEKEKKPHNESKQKTDDKKTNNDNEIKSKKKKKNKDKIKHVEEASPTTTTTTDSDNPTDSPAVTDSPRVHFSSPKLSKFSPGGTAGFQSLTVPAPQSGASFTNGLSSPDLTNFHIPPQPHIAQLAQVQQQLQSYPPNSFVNKSIYSNNVSVQEQLQSLSQMARDGDEVLITLSVNTLAQKQHTNTTTPTMNGNTYNTNNQLFTTSIQNNNPYSLSTSYNHMRSSGSNLVMPRNLEIVAKGFVRIQNEHPQLQQQQQQLTKNPYYQPPFAFVHPSFPPRYPVIPCHHPMNSSLQVPIGPSIQPIFAPPNTITSSNSIRSPNCTDFVHDLRNHVNIFQNSSQMSNAKCDYLCQSSLNHPDFRGRPSPGVITNPYFTNPSSSMNFSADTSAKQKQKHKPLEANDLNVENMTRTYSSIY